MSEKNELLPCPFCGGPVSLEKTTDRRKWWGVVCRNTANLGGTCAIQQIPSATEEAAIRRWNTREAAPAQEVEPVYQFSAEGEKWIDIEKCDYDKLQTMLPNEHLHTRILYLSPITAEQAAADMKLRCMDIVKNWRRVHALEECCDHAQYVALSEVGKLIESLPTSDTAMEEMRRDAERFRWLESNAFLEELDMDSQSIDEQIAIDATFESLDAIAAEKYQTEPQVTGSEN